MSIDDYLDVLRRQLRGHHARDDILSEVEDHLRTTCDRFVADGLDRPAAEAETVRTFGESDVVADALLAANGAPAVPTSFTQGVGTTAMFGSVAWLVLAAAFWASYLTDGDGSWGGTPRLLFMLGMAALAASGAVTVLLQLALRTRLGGFGPMAMLGLGVTCLSTAASVVAWAIPLWSALFAIGCLPAAVLAFRHGAAPRPWAVMYGAAWPLGFATLLVLRSAEFGGVDQWGDYPAAYLTGMSVGCVLMAVGLAGLGRWLHSEQPVDIHPPGAAIA